MTQEQIDNNHRTILEELRATKREEVETYIAALEKSSYFTTSCKSHDEAPGGLANHLLWTLWFAKRRNKAFEVEDLVLACLECVPVGEEMKEFVEMCKKLAIGFCDSIPYGTEPEKEFEGTVADEYVDVIFDLGEHQMWIGAEGRKDVFDGSEETSQFMVHHVLDVPVRPGSAADVMVMGDDAGSYSIMLLSEKGLYRSDKVVFGYTELLFYISRMPQYRSSYIVAKNSKGRWGVYRLREDRKMRSGHLIISERVVPFEYRDSGKALNELRGNSGHVIRVKDSYFYTLIRYGEN